ncbi:Uncharacterised protein [Streptococcus pneumoniae]|nr:Uncharacterised protein [Streptococcus pneumoniae]SME36215.1 hypothetical protein BACERE00195_04512 [Bacillus cereus]
MGKLLSTYQMKNEGLHTDILYEFNELYCEMIIERGQAIRLNILIV